MDSYLLLKFIHILSAVVVAGTGAGIAFFMLMASRSNNPEAIKVTAKHVIMADWIFTLPSVIALLITGPLLMIKLGYSFSAPWFIWVIGLFLFVGICWIPVLRIQYRLYQLSNTMTLESGVTLEFKKLMRLWVVLGVLAFAAILVIFWLMIFKPISII